MAASTGTVIYALLVSSSGGAAISFFWEFSVFVTDGGEVGPVPVSITVLPSVSESGERPQLVAEQKELPYMIAITSSVTLISKINTEAKNKRNLGFIVLFRSRLDMKGLSFLCESL